MKNITAKNNANIDLDISAPANIFFFPESLSR